MSLACFVLRVSTQNGVASVFAFVAAAPNTCSTHACVHLVHIQANWADLMLLYARRIGIDMSTDSAVNALRGYKVPARRHAFCVWLVAFIHTFCVLACCLYLHQHPQCLKRVRSRVWLLLSQLAAEQAIQSFSQKQVRKRVRLVLGGKHHSPPPWSVGILVAYIFKRKPRAKPRAPRPGKQVSGKQVSGKSQADHKPAAKRRRKSKVMETAADAISVDKTPTKGGKGTPKKVKDTAKKVKKTAKKIKRGKEPTKVDKHQPNTKPAKRHATPSKTTKHKHRPKTKVGQKAGTKVRKFPRRKFPRRIVVRVTNGRYHCVLPTYLAKLQNSDETDQAEAKATGSTTPSSSKAILIQTKRRGRPPSSSLSIQAKKGGKSPSSSASIQAKRRGKSPSSSASIQAKRRGKSPSSSASIQAKKGGKSPSSSASIQAKRRGRPPKRRSRPPSSSKTTNGNTAGIRVRLSRGKSGNWTVHPKDNT